MNYTFTKLNNRFDEYLAMGLPYYDCVIMKEGKCVYRNMKGFVDIENKISPNGTEIFNIYSCSKLITCVAALKLWEKKLFDFDDKLSDYMPEFSNMTVLTGRGVEKAKNPITIRHLFTMTAGFSYDVWSPSLKKCVEDTKGVCPTRKTMEYLAKEPLLFEPGTRWEYSLCHDVLAALVEILSGERFSDFVEKNIFIPLGMKDTTFNRDKIDKTRFIKQYRFDQEKKIFFEIDSGNVLQIGSAYDSGGAGCVSTVNDYVKFIEAVRTGSVFARKETLKLLSTNALTGKQSETLWANDIYGYSMGQRCPKDDKRTDFGWDGMAGAYYSIDTKNNISVFFGTQVIGCVKFNLLRTEIIEKVKECVL